MKNQTLYYLFLMVWASSLMGANGQDAPTDPGLTIQKRSVAAFNCLHVRSAMQVSIRDGSPDQIEFTCQNYVVPYVRIRVKDGELIVKLSRPIRRKGTRAVLVTLHNGNLTRIRAGQAASIESDVPLQSDQLAISLKGASGLAAPLTVNRLSVALEDASGAALRGTTSGAFFNLTGASQLSAEGLSIANLNIHLLKASQASVWVSDTLSASAGGVSVLTYRGTPAVIAQSTTQQAVVHAQHTANP